MRALVLTDWGRLEVLSVPDPQPAPDESVIAILATGICGSDLHGFTGENGRRTLGQVMGHETVGRVVQASASAGGPAEGTLVTVNPVVGCGQCIACLAGTPGRCPDRSVLGVNPALHAAFAELMAVPAANLIELPVEREDHGALVEPLAVGYHAARLASADGVPQGCLVIGGGPIGQASAIGLRRLGTENVLISEPNESRRRLCEQLGFDTLDPGAKSERFEGLRAEAVIDAVGSSRSMETALTASMPGGTVVLVGMGEPKLSLAAYDISTLERTIRGSFCYTVEDFASTARWTAEQRSDDLEPLIQARVPLTGAQDAFAELAGGRSSASKILVVPGLDP